MILINCYCYKCSILLSYPAALIASAAGSYNPKQDAGQRLFEWRALQELYRKTQNHITEVIMLFLTCKNYSPKPTGVSTHFEKAISNANTLLLLSFSGTKLIPKEFFFFFSSSIFSYKSQGTHINGQDGLNFWITRSLRKVHSLTSFLNGRRDQFTWMSYCDHNYCPSLIVNLVVHSLSGCRLSICYALCVIHCMRHWTSQQYRDPLKEVWMIFCRQ